MSDRISYFTNGNSTSAVFLPLDYQQAIADWAGLRTRMIRHVPEAFTRDEWAYLITFLEPENLYASFTDAFGTSLKQPTENMDRLYRPRGPIGVWLPNNVSLLGPLTLILLSLTGQYIKLKLGSAAKDLAGEFLAFASENLSDGELKDYLNSRVLADRFDRDDHRQKEMVRESEVRIVFGSDQAARDIHALPHPLGSVGFSFTDRQSEAWIEASAVTDDVLETLIKVFAIYGQAGCTSPRRVILLDGSEAQAEEISRSLSELWPDVVKDDVAMNVASANILGLQHALALGWKARLVPRNAAVIANGPLDLPLLDAPMTLCVHWASRENALASLPRNIQTIGHVLENPRDPSWLRLLATSRALRFVPLGQVHYFNSSWDGREFWRESFEVMEVRS